MPHYQVSSAIDQAIAKAKHNKLNVTGNQWELKVAKCQRYEARENASV